MHRLPRLHNVLGSSGTVTLAANPDEVRSRFLLERSAFAVLALTALSFAFEWSGQLDTAGGCGVALDGAAWGGEPSQRAG